MEAFFDWKALSAAAVAIVEFVLAGGEIHITRQNVRIKMPPRHPR
jgi:hypothetical protein